MKLFHTFLCLLETLAVVSGIPTQKRSSYKVDRLQNPQYTGRNGPRSLLKSLRKYRMPVPDSLLEAAGTQDDLVVGRGLMQTGKRQNSRSGMKNGTVGIVTATPIINDLEYLCPVEIGGQTVYLDFDTGSSDFWVFSSQLPPNSTDGHAVFDHTQSRTFTFMKDASFKISYGDGSSAEGNVGTDTVDVGGATVTHQAISLATSVSQSFVDNAASSGILGLAFRQLNTVKPEPQRSFFENVMQSLLEPVFTADLRAHNTGAFEFGRIDESKFVGQLEWSRVNTSRGFWELDSESFSVGSGELQPATHNMPAVIDTGTSLVLTDRDITNGYYSHIPGAVEDPASGGFIFPCNETVPDLHLDVGGKMAVVRGDDIRYSQVNSRSKIPQLYSENDNKLMNGSVLRWDSAVAVECGHIRRHFVQEQLCCLPRR